jgi:hypothetical protein
MWTAWLGVAIAGPTQAQMNSASWSALSHTERAELGRVDILTANVAGIDCFRGVATTDVPAHELLAVITDFSTADAWSTTGVTDGRVLNRTASSIAYFQYLDVPSWTLSADRYWFLQGQLSVGPERTELAWDKLPAGSPWLAERDRFAAAHPDAIEPPVNVGSWRFDSVPEGVRITYSVCTTSGGSIPVALQNAASRRTLPDNLADVVREARRR